MRCPRSRLRRQWIGRETEPSSLCRKQSLTGAHARLRRQRHARGSKLEWIVSGRGCAMQEGSLMCCGRWRVAFASGAAFRWACGAVRASTVRPESRTRPSAKERTYWNVFGGLHVLVDSCAMIRCREWEWDTANGAIKIPAQHKLHPAEPLEQQWSWTICLGFRFVLVFLASFAALVCVCVCRSHCVWCDFATMKTGTEKCPTQEFPFAFVYLSLTTSSNIVFKIIFMFNFDLLLLRRRPKSILVGHIHSNGPTSRRRVIDRWCLTSTRTHGARCAERNEYFRFHVPLINAKFRSQCVVGVRARQRCENPLRMKIVKVLPIVVFFFGFHRQPPTQHQKSKTKLCKNSHEMKIETRKREWKIAQHVVVDALLSIRCRSQSLHSPTEISDFKWNTQKSNK